MLITTIFPKHEQVEYAREGLEGLEITYKDNRPVLDLFLSRPIGLLSLLDEQCRGFSVRINNNKLHRIYTSLYNVYRSAINLYEYKITQIGQFCRLLNFMRFYYQKDSSYTSW